ncbi:MAG: glycerate kinase, partial [Planctomycetaceae bacterium]
QSARPRCRVSGGEPVVRLVEPRLRGQGGRNQQLVLAAMDRLAKHPDFRPRDRGRLVLLSGGTDGEDGPTDAAGAMLRREVWDAAERLGLSAEDYLRRNDAYSFFQQTGGLLLTGTTGTNVCDVRVLVVRPDVT